MKSSPILPCHLFIIPPLERWYEAWSRNSDHTVKTFPLNYLARVAFYRRKFTYGPKSLVLSCSFLRISLQWIMLLWSMIFLSIIQMVLPLWTALAYLDVCLPGNGGSIVCLSTWFHTPIKIHSKWNLGVTMTLNTMTLFPITLSCPIVQNSPKRPYSKSRRNQMREKSITFLSPLSLPWLNYWNKMLHLEESLERQRERKRGGGERNTFRDMGAI